jgi:glutamate 5-kinase
VIEVEMDDCSVVESTALLAVSVRKLNTDILSFILVHFVGGFAFIEGEFEKDDIVRIMDFQGNQVGVGKANCDSAQAREAMGKHGKKPVVHYDYLYIE